MIQFLIIKTFPYNYTVISFLTGLWKLPQYSENDASSRWLELLKLVFFICALLPSVSEHLRVALRLVKVCFCKEKVCCARSCSSDTSTLFEKLGMRPNVLFPLIGTRLITYCRVIWYGTKCYLNTFSLHSKSRCLPVSLRFLISVKGAEVSPTTQDWVLRISMYIYYKYVI